MANITRSRWLRELILSLLSSADGAGFSAGMTFNQINGGFARRRREASEADIRRELNDLTDDQLVRHGWDEDLECEMFFIASRGREFCKANFPWEKIDEFTGRKL